MKLNFGARTNVLKTCHKKCSVAIVSVHAPVHKSPSFSLTASVRFACVPFALPSYQKVWAKSTHDLDIEKRTPKALALSRESHARWG